MSQSVSISEKEPTRDILDFEFLKQTGIGYIEQLSGKVWTDYNLHDPGITLLEALSYALTELGYRSRHSVKDLLARAVYTRQKQGKELLIDASEILVSAPVTINDYRKLLIDIDGVKNVHITPDSSLPDFNGLYNLQIELFPDYDDNFNRAIIKNEVSLILNQNRNLAEDFNTISFLEHDPISFEIEIETDGKQNASELLYDIYSRLADHLSPGIQFYDLAALLAKGYTVDQIFNGPLLKNGFILDEELEQLRLRQQIYTSDIVHFLMDIEGVSYVKNIKIHKSGAEHFNWTCPVAKGKAPELDVANTEIRLFNNNRLINLQEYESVDMNKVYQREHLRSAHKKLAFTREYGHYRNLAQYFPVQNELPETYGIGEVGLPVSATEKRKAQARQLKGYLLFFEQILANFFAQLDNLDKLFSTEDITKTYFTQPVFEIPGIEYLYKPFIIQCYEKNIDLGDTALVKQEWRKYKRDNQKDIQQLLNGIVEDSVTFLDRRNRVLNHLLARFGLDYNEYRFFNARNTDQGKARIESKQEILNHISAIGRDRAKAFNNIFVDLLSETNISGFEHRLNKLLGIQSNSRKFMGISANNLLNTTPDITNPGQPQTDDPTGFYDILFSNYDSELVLRDLFKLGSNSKHWKAVPGEDETCTILLVDEAGIAVAKYGHSNVPVEKVEPIIHNIAQKIADLDDRSESIHIIEHILLRPSLQESAFGYGIRDYNNNICFRSDEFKTAADRDQEVSELFAAGKTPDNFFVEKVGFDQYKIMLRKPDRSANFRGVVFYSSEQEALSEAEKLQLFFVDIVTDNQQAHFDAFTSYHHSRLMMEDPFSFMVSVLLPDWPANFQNERYKAHIENIVNNEMPAHIVANIVWMDFETLNQTRLLCDDLLKEKSRRKADSDKVSRLINEIFARITQ